VPSGLDVISVCQLISRTLVSRRSSWRLDGSKDCRKIGAWRWSQPAARSTRTICDHSREHPQPTSHQSPPFSYTVTLVIARHAMSLVLHTVTIHAAHVALMIVR
jgi:hypothetical protein